MVILVIILYYFVISRNGNLLFQKKVSKDPAFVYEQLLEDGAWMITDKEIRVDKEKYDGVFFMCQVLVEW